MMKYTLLLILVAVTGCAAPPAWLANHYDRNDPCQARAELGRPAGYTRPEWCGSALGRTYIYNAQNQRVGYIK